MVRTGAPKMETTLYEDPTYHQRAVVEVNRLKRSMTLDLNVRQSAKRQKVSWSTVNSPPDLSMLKLGTPELEKLIIDHQNGLVTTTPTPSQILFPRNVTEEQEIYARGFVDALNELHHSDSSQSGGFQSDLPRIDETDTLCGGRRTYTSLDSRPHYPSVSSSGFEFVVVPPEGAVVVKDEPQTVPNSSPPVSPIDMESQEKIKLERKRQRNRVAASKCRRRKLERIAKLEEKVKCLKGENAELAGVVNKLKEQVCHLKEQVMDHVNSGCQITLHDFQ